MGGIGKTTLAKYAFENSFCKNHFDVRSWATVSQEYNVETVLFELSSGNRIPNSIGNVNEVGEQLRKMLWNRRYLIVLDDMWSVEAWEEICRFFPDNENGSCVIVTTRISNVAACLSDSPFQMDFLDDSQSWKLFCGSAFGEEDCPVELEEFGKKIVKRCNGLPLSIVVTGGHLRRSSRAIEYWEMVAYLMNPISGLGEDEKCLKIIHLSYKHLPARLKPCFLYFGIFPEDEWVDASRLLSFWVAEGFVRNCASLSLEEAAEDCLKDLIERNLILVVQKRWDGKAEYCIIHDTVRELCLKVGKQDKFLGVLDTTKGGERRIVVPRKLTSSSPHKHDVGSLQLPSKLRSFICQILLPVESQFLRVLKASVTAQLNESVKENGKYSVGDMFQKVNLRCLTFYINPVGALPYQILSSISLLWNMQTLIIGNGDIGHLVPLPYDIWEMTQLRHLEFVGGKCHIPNPDHHGAIGDRPNQQECIVLENLHTLVGVHNLRLAKEVCQRIPNIKKLHLIYVASKEGDLKENSYYCFDNLGLFNKLKSLYCYFGNESNWHGSVRSFMLPSSLEKLTLVNCHWEDLTKIMKSLPCLGSLSLSLVKGSEWDLAEEVFPRLKSLDISCCDDLVFWNANSSHFPILENLYIWRTPILSEIPFDIGEIPTLRCIYLRECSVSAAVSAMRIVSEQERDGNEDLMLDVIFKEMEEKEKLQSLVQQECLTTNNLLLITSGMRKTKFEKVIERFRIKYSLSL